MCGCNIRSLEIGFERSVAECASVGEHRDHPATGGQAAEQPAAFESSLLADIDVTSAASDGRYRSPLLADLQQNPDELEGVGLAKWRPEARLTAEDQTATPPPKSRRKH